MTKKRIQYLFIVLFSLMSVISYSNGKKKGHPLPRPDSPPIGPELPIDGGVSIILVLGAAYGVYKLKKKE